MVIRYLSCCLMCLSMVGTLVHGMQTVETQLKKPRKKSSEIMPPPLPRSMVLRSDTKHAELVLREMALAYAVGKAFFYKSDATIDAQKAVAMFYVAATKGAVPAMLMLGFCYENGIGVKKDLGCSFAWYKKAADNKNPEGQYNLGYAYEHGLGVEVSVSAAIDFYVLAASQGHVGALRAFQQLKRI